MLRNVCSKVKALLKTYAVELTWWHPVTHVKNIKRIHRLCVCVSAYAEADDDDDDVQWFNVHLKADWKPA